MLKDLNIRPPDLMIFGHAGSYKEGNGSDIDIQMAQQIMNMYGPCATVLSWYRMCHYVTSANSGPKSVTHVCLVIVTFSIA